MTLGSFSEIAGLLEVQEIEKIRLLAFYYHMTQSKTEFSLLDIASWCEELHLAKPNLSRLKSNLKTSRKFIKGKVDGTWKLPAAEVVKLQALYPGIHSKSEEIFSDEAILPRPLFEKTRGYIESLAKQINASYDYNIFDGCAVLMRRLLEILLILSYVELKINSVIKDTNGNYVLLEQIVSNAKGNPTLNLSRNSREDLDLFRTLGNFSAHKIEYTCHRTDINNVAIKYRAIIEELLYKSGIRK